MVTSFGKPERARTVMLPNGLRLVAVADRTTPIVEIRLSTSCAGLGPGHAAEAQVLSDVLLPDAEQISPERREAWLVTELACGRDLDRLGIFGYTPAASLADVLKEIAACVARPRYTDMAVRESKQRLVSQVAIGQADARRTALAALMRRRHDAQVAPWDLPSPAALAGVEPDMVRACQNTRLLPNGSTLVLAGDLPSEEVSGLVEEAFAAWQGGDRVSEPLQTSTQPAAEEIVLVHRPRSAQAEILLTGTAPHREHAGRPAYDMANAVLGGGIGSRLVRNLHEEKGYAYLAASATEVMAGRPTSIVRLAASHASAAKALAETRSELAALTNHPATPAEIAHAKQLLAGRVVTSTASTSSFATLLANLITEGADLTWCERYASRLSTVTPDGVAEAARTYFTPAVFDTAVVGDADALMPSLEEVTGLPVRVFERLEDVVPPRPLLRKLPQREGAS